MSTAEPADTLRLCDEFLAAVTHDLKVPLTVLKVRTQLLQRQIRRAGGIAPERLNIEKANLDL